MESLALMVAIIVIACTFIASFAGFIIADNTKSVLWAMLGASIPMLVIIAFTAQLPLSFFWLGGYLLGYFIGYLFRRP